MFVLTNAGQFALDRNTNDWKDKVTLWSYIKMEKLIANRITKSGMDRRGEKAGKKFTKFLTHWQISIGMHQVAPLPI